MRHVPLRSYVYISKTKVDSLYDQIPQKQLNKLAKKLTIDLKIVKAEFGVDEGEKSLVAKTQIVERYLDHESGVADVDAAGEDEDVEFFRGRLPLSWTGGREGGFAFFTGRTDDTVLVMGGSGRHLVSAPPDPPPSWTSTSTPGLIAELRAHVFGGVDGAPTLERPLVDGSGQPLPPGAPLPSDHLAAVVAATYADLHGSVPETKMAFLAVPMAIESLEPPPESWMSEADKALVRGATRALLASPLYVSLRH